MKPSADWTTPADIRDEVRRHWQRGRILAARLEATPLFPLAVKFRRPDSRALSAQFDAVRKWIRALEEGGKAARGFGYDILWEEINHRQLGRNRLPSGICVASERDALRLIGMQREAERFSTLADLILGQFPALRDRVLPPAAVDPRFPAGRGFEARYGLAAKPPLVRFRLLDRRLVIRGLSDLTIPAADFAGLDLAAARVFVTENEINGLAFPDLVDSLVVFGLGYGLDRLAEAQWLARTNLYYWGDIDTHGFAMLDQLRAAFPEARSLLMDRRTLLAHRPFWVQETDRHNGTLSRLTPAERELFEELQHDRLGDHVRLEQERISFGWLEQALAALPAPWNHGA
jgi:hypothetical protein